MKLEFTINKLKTTKEMRFFLPKLFNVNNNIHICQSLRLIGNKNNIARKFTVLAFGQHDERYLDNQRVISIDCLSKGDKVLVELALVSIQRKNEKAFTSQILKRFDSQEEYSEVIKDFDIQKTILWRKVCSVSIKSLVEKHIVTNDYLHMTITLKVN